VYRNYLRHYWCSHCEKEGKAIRELVKVVVAKEIFILPKG